MLSRTCLALFPFLVLIANPAYSQGRRRPAAKSFLSDTLTAAVPLTPLSANPNGLAAGVPSVITSTISILDAALIPSSLVLQRLDDSGRVIATLGTMHDDGQNGDATAGDKKFTLQVVLNELGGTVRLQANAAFSGSIKRRFSDPVSLSVQPSLTALNATEDFAALNLGDRVLFWWPALPAQTAKITVFRATAQVGPFTTAFSVSLSSSIYTAVDTVNGTTSDLYYRMDALSSTGSVLKSFATVKAPKYVAPPAQTLMKTNFVSGSAPAAAPVDPQNGIFLTDAKFQEVNSMDSAQIWAFLRRSSSYLAPSDPVGMVQDDDGVFFFPAGVIRNAAVTYTINPQLLLVLIQTELLLISNSVLPPPAADGYFHLTACPSKNLRDQIPCLAGKLRADFDAIGAVGHTPNGWEVGVAHVVGDKVNDPKASIMTVTPANRAAAVLFARTPLVGYNWAGGASNQPGVSHFVFIWKNLFSNMAFTLHWQNCGACPEAPEVTVSGTTLQLGVVGREELGTQNETRHGASAQLPPNSGYTVSVEANLTTWDSYSPPADSATGYWDVFSVTVSGSQYWLLPLSDPITSFFSGLFLWPDPVGDQAVIKYGDGKNSTFIGAPTIAFSASGFATNYLNVMLDTATDPNSDHAYPSWGSISVTKVQPNDPINTEYVIVY